MQKKIIKDKDANTLVEDTLNSIDKITSHAPDELLFERIINNVSQKEISYIKDNAFGKYAIAFAILILINAFSFFNYHKITENKIAGDAANQSEALSEFAKEYFSGQSEYNYGRK